MSELLHFKPLVLVLVAFATIQSPQSKKISAISSSINGPTAMALDNNGHLFVIEGEEDKVRRIDLSDGMISTAAGSGRDLKGTAFTGMPSRPQKPAFSIRFRLQWTHQEISS